MAVKKSTGGAKKKAASTTKKSSASKSSAAKKSTTKKSSAPKAKKAAPKKGVKKASSAAAKLTSNQSDLLKKIGSSGESGYKSDKKAEQRTIDALQERKLVKRGAKDKTTGTYHYLISNAGKKHLDSQAGTSASAGVGTQASTS
jgi:DNA-binding protein HU-beta